MRTRRLSETMSHKKSSENSIKSLKDLKKIFEKSHNCKESYLMEPQKILQNNFSQKKLKRF